VRPRQARYQAALRPDMKCTTDSKALSNFTPNPRHHFFALLCQITRTSQPCAPTSSRTPLGYYWVMADRPNAVRTKPVRLGRTFILYRRARPSTRWLVLIGLTNRIVRSASSISSVPIRTGRLGHQQRINGPAEDDILCACGCDTSSGGRQQVSP
jgi:hypothetical protein